VRGAPHRSHWLPDVGRAAVVPHSGVARGGLAGRQADPGTASAARHPDDAGRSQWGCGPPCAAPEPRAAASPTTASARRDWSSRTASARPQSVRQPRPALRLVSLPYALAGSANHDTEFAPLASECWARCLAPGARGRCAPLCRIQCGTDHGYRAVSTITRGTCRAPGRVGRDTDSSLLATGAWPCRDAAGPCEPDRRQYAAAGQCASEGVGNDGAA
jgi:hypothetical protein